MTQWNKTSVLTTTSKDGALVIRKDALTGTYRIRANGDWVKDGVALRGFPTLRKAKEYCASISC